MHVFGLINILLSTSVQRQIHVNITRQTIGLKFVGREIAVNFRRKAVFDWCLIRWMIKIT